jgi:hypothetical protein
MAVCTIKDGKLIGNDIAGGKYSGTVTHANGKISVDADFTLPPGLIAIWGSSPSDAWMTRKIQHTIPEDRWCDGHPIHLESEDMYLYLARVPDEWSVASGPDGFKILADILQRADAAWAAKSDS